MAEPIPFRRRHKWSDKTRPTIHLSIRNCLNCALVEHSRHENGIHWKEWFQEKNPELRLMKMPECEGNSAFGSTPVLPDDLSSYQPDRMPGAEDGK